MYILIKSINTENNCWKSMPCSEADLQKICHQLEIENTAFSECYVLDVYNDEKGKELLQNNVFQLEELNFFTKRLESFTQAELTSFYATAYALSYKTMKELINLTFNTHCYDFVADFEDLNMLGKQVYLNQVGGMEVEEFEIFDGKAYITQMIGNHKNPMITPYGIVYQNQNQLSLVYDKNFPAYGWEENLITLCLKTESAKEYLYLPIVQKELTKALERLEKENIDDCVVEIESHGLLEQLESIVFSDMSFENLNEFAMKFSEIRKSEIKHLNELIGYTKVNNIPALKVLIDCVVEFEEFPDIHSPKEYGIHMIKESGQFEYDGNFDEYIDFAGYGKDKIKKETGAFTDRGYIVYLGYNKKMEKILKENIGIESKLSDSIQQELKLYMPLHIISFKEENEYGDMQVVDYQVELTNTESVGYMEDIVEALEKENQSMGDKRGMMDYYDDHDSVNAKVQKYIFSVEKIEGELMGVAILTLNAPLNHMELVKIKSQITGQASDGFGEGFEQKEINTNDREISVSFWNSNDWSLKTADELGITEQKFEMGGMNL